jgi:hypothetical protein
MLNKKEMQSFAEQFLTGKVKIRKNEPIHGKADSYHAVQNRVFIQFEESSIILKVPNVGLLSEYVAEMKPLLRNYIKNIHKIIEVENKNRISAWPRQIEGQIYTEIAFDIKKKKPNLSVFTLIIYPMIKTRMIDVGFWIYDLPLMNHRSDNLIINIESKQKVIDSDLIVFKLPVIREIIDFNDVLDEVFIDQLNTLEMALL